MSDGDLSWPLRRGADLFPNATAVIDGGRSVTYAELRRRVRALSAAWEGLGVPAGSRVGFLGVNSLAHLECWMAAPGAGRVLVDLNFRLAETELAFIVDDCGVEVLVVDPDRLSVARALRARCASLRQLVCDGTDACPDDCIPYEQLVDGAAVGSVDPAMETPGLATDTLAAISYTGGTTGAPKGVMLSHGNLLANARHNLLATGHGRADRWLHVCPMFHVAGTANVFACTWVGATQVILPRFDPAAVAGALEEQAITHTVLVPTMLGMLLDELERHPRGPLPSLRHIQYAASPIAPALQRRVLDTFACDIVQFYGMTEAAPTVTCLTAADHRRGQAGEEPYAGRLRSIGRPVVGVEAEVRDLDDRRLPPGEVGELSVRGPNIMLGYWNRAEATASALHACWYRTGDAARVDADGYLYMVDRLKDMIITGGENVYSVEVEAALAEHAAVAEAAVFGIPDARWGEAVHAVVALTPESQVTSAQLIEHCRSLIASYKVPRSIEIRADPLPKSGAGKLLKTTLREPFWAGHDRRVS